MSVPETGDLYAGAITEFRRRKDEHFASGRGPVQGEALRTFRGLSYYAPDEAWALSAPLEAPGMHDAGEFTLDTNTGQPRQMALIGRVRVPLPDGERPLSVFGPLGEAAPARVFIPFRDATSGPETYGAGRYLDAPVSRGSGGEALVQLDFNLAYHPYCAYGDGWTCPLPPAENRLDVAVRAGERLPQTAQ
ncbi:DUF1684 domain-containing protein [Deinococcus gobiensis]|uniref:DUF1684 domain-containing protein n=1 Tax=Deinococcus gobiensis TaxID=502394 RepID=UPI000306BD84|nr:DUF1684 domain-containing protein [Deinococcus gobiensis]